MENARPADVLQTLSPILRYLQDHLPSYVYDLLFTLLSYSAMFVSGAMALVTSLGSWKPWEWDAQRILPPLITVLVAYYALITAYRTTSWVFRIGVSAVKWSLIIGLIGVGLGYLSGQEQGQPATRPGGPIPASRSRKGRPQPWDKFDAHQQWQYQEDELPLVAQEGQAESQRIVEQILSTAGRAIGGYGAAVDWLGKAKDMLDELVDSANAAQEERSRTARDTGADGSKQRKQARAKGASRKQTKSTR